MEETAMKKHRTFNLFILTILVAAGTFSSSVNAVSAQDIQPIIVVFIENNDIVGFHWPVETILTLTIDDPETPGPVNYTGTAQVEADPDPNVPDSTAARFPLGDDFQLEPGHIVTLDGGGTNKVHTVTGLTRDGVDMPGDRLWGHAAPGTIVEVINRWQRDIVRWETADAGGYWEADFSKAGDLPEEALTRNFGLGDHFMILQNDRDGDHTQVDFVMPFPIMEARLTQNSLSWRDWPAGYPVELTIDDPSTPADPDYSATVGPETPQHPDEPNCWCFPMENGSLLRPGHVVTMNNGFLQKTLKISGLKVAGINSSLDTVLGTAEPGAKVYVQRYDVPRHVTADGTGAWTADFSVPGGQEDEALTNDLMPWDDGFALVSDEDFDTTQVTWPMDLGIGLEYYVDHVGANNWYTGDEVTLTIDDPKTSDPVDFSSSTFPVVGPWYYSGLGFEISPEFRILPGHLVNLTQFGHTKTCAATPIRVTGVNLVTDQVTGTSNPGDQVQVSVWAPGTGGDQWARNRYAQADENGNWQVDFSVPGTHIIRHPNEVMIVDITPDKSVYADTGDDNACFTSVHWRLPVVRVRLTEGEIHAQFFAPGYPVTLTVFQPDDLVNPVYTATRVMGDDLLLVFDYPDTLDIGPGYVVRATNGIMTKEHTVTSVWIDEVDLLEDQVHGTAKAGTPVSVFACYPTFCAQRSLVTGPDTTWLADFSQPGPEPGEEEVVDLETAYPIVAFQDDEDGDRTRVHWALNQPPEIGALTGPVTPIPVNSLIQVSGNFSDPDPGDAHTAQWNWGDGITADGVIDEEGGTVSGSHAYTAAGIYTVQLALCDAAGACDQALYQYVVVYDPTGGFVTGGGWIWSPAGAYRAGPALDGKATFGFVSKYLKGANVPSGNTEFQFNTGDLNFKSTVYQWLVVNRNSSNAQFKGYGTINGSGNYGFMLWAADGVPDTFRIKIWVADDETNIVYDNDTSQPIEGGSIVIHTK